MAVDSAKKHKPWYVTLAWVAGALVVVFGIPLMVLDITGRTAPTIQIWDQFLDEVGLPVRNLMVKYFQTQFPWISSFLGRVFRKRFTRIDRDYFSGVSLHQDFLTHKSYRLLLFQKQGAQSGSV